MKYKSDESALADAARTLLRKVPSDTKAITNLIPVIGLKMNKANKYLSREYNELFLRQVNFSK